jgi:hypothetical protein
MGKGSTEEGYGTAADPHGSSLSLASTILSGAEIRPTNQEGTHKNP